MPVVQCVCRYVDVLPCDSTRVRVGHCHQQRGSDYINASHVSSKAGEAPAWHYIASQVGSNVLVSGCAGWLAIALQAHAREEYWPLSTASDETLNGDAGVSGWLRTPAQHRSA